MWQLAWAHPEFGNILASCNACEPHCEPIPWLSARARARGLFLSLPTRARAVLPRSLAIRSACSGSYDRQVYVWKEHAPQHWALVHKYLGHEGSVNAIAWAPREAGMRLVRVPLPPALAGAP